MELFAKFPPPDESLMSTATRPGSRQHAQRDARPTPAPCASTKAAKPPAADPQTQLLEEATRETAARDEAARDGSAPEEEQAAETSSPRRRPQRRSRRRRRRRAGKHSQASSHSQSASSQTSAKNAERSSVSTEDRRNVQKSEHAADSSQPARPKRKRRRRRRRRGPSHARAETAGSAASNTTSRQASNKQKSEPKSAQKSEAENEPDRASTDVAETPDASANRASRSEGSAPRASDESSPPRPAAQKVVRRVLARPGGVRPQSQTATSPLRPELMPSGARRAGQRSPAGRRLVGPESKARSGEDRQQPSNRQPQRRQHPERASSAPAVRETPSHRGTRTVSTTSAPKRRRRTRQARSSEPLPWQPAADEVFDHYASRWAEATGYSALARQRGPSPYGVLLLAYLPFLVVFFANLWRHPHYRFFPLVVLAAATMLFQRLRSAESPCAVGRGWNRLSHLLMTGSAALLPLSLMFFSPWLAGVSATLMLAACLIPWSRAHLQAKILWPWALLLFLIPVPLGFDATLVQWLQRGAAYMASRLLDFVGIRHVLQGTIIELSDRQLFVEEACSGIQSLFSLTFAAAFLAVWNRRSGIHVWTLVTFAAFWALVCNIARIFLIVYCLKTQHIDLTAGWYHDLLGFALYGFAIVMLLAYDQFCLFLYGPILYPDNLPTPLADRWNHWVAGLPRKTDTVQADSGLPPASPRLRWSPTVVLVTLVVLCAGGAQATVLALPLIPRPDENTQITFDPVETVTRETLPEHVGAWSLATFEDVQRTAESQQGQHSKIWVYDAGNHNVMVSLDFPFATSHDLSTCYRNKGWNVTGERVLTQTGPAPHFGEWTATEVEMTQPLQSDGYLLFSSFDGSGRVVAPPAYVASKLDSLVGRFRTAPLWELLRDPQTVRPLQCDVYQLQMFVMSESPLSDAEREAMQRQFFVIRDELHRRWFSQDRPAGPSAQVESTVAQDQEVAQ